MSNAPVGGGRDGKYGCRSLASVRQKFGDISADCMKFKLSLRRIRSCQPSGVTEDEIVGMAIAIHVGACDKIGYDKRTFEHDKWVNARAWKVLRAYPKWGAEVSSNAEVTNAGFGSSSSTAHQNLPVQTTNVLHRSALTSESTPTSAPPDLREQSEAGATVLPSVDVTATELAGNKAGVKRGREHVGRGKAKTARREEEVARSRRDIAASLERKADIMEERNSFTLVSMDSVEMSAEDRRVKQEFLRSTRILHLARMKEKLQGFGVNREATAQNAHEPSTISSPPGGQACQPMTVRVRETPSGANEAKAGCRNDAISPSRLSETTKTLPGLPFSGDECVAISALLSRCGE